MFTYKGKIPRIRSSDRWVYGEGISVSAVENDQVLKNVLIQMFFPIWKNKVRREHELCMKEDAIIAPALLSDIEGRDNGEDVISQPPATLLKGLEVSSVKVEGPKQCEKLTEHGVEVKAENIEFEKGKKQTKKTKKKKKDAEEAQMSWRPNEARWNPDDIIDERFFVKIQEVDADLLTVWDTPLPENPFHKTLGPTSSLVPKSAVVTGVALEPNQKPHCITLYKSGLLKLDKKVLHTFKIDVENW